jgi:hypothetical protein
MMGKSVELSVAERVPAYHYDCAQSRAIIETLTDASLAARDAIYDLVQQFWVASATWGLDLWEGLLAIDTDRSKSDESRRRAIITKMQGSGTCNSDMVRRIAQALTGYEAEVVEHPAEYTFSLRFLGEEAGVVPIDKREIIDTVEVIKPAHLKFVIEAIRWQDLEEKQFTWADMEQVFPTWGDFEEKFFINKKG